MASLSNCFVNYPPIFEGIDFSLWKRRVKTYVKFIDFDLWNIISYGPSIPTWIKDDGTAIVKPKEKLNRDKKERLNKNAMGLYILQCSLHNDIFNHGCSCEIANELWGRLLLLYKYKNEGNMANILDNFNGKKEINHLCLMTNEQITDSN